MLVVLGSPAATNVCSYPSIPLLVTYSLFFSTDYMPPEIPEILGPGPLPLVSPSSFKLHHLQPSVLRPPYQLSLPFKPPTILPRSCYPTTYSPAHLPHFPSSPSSQAPSEDNDFKPRPPMPPRKQTPKPASQHTEKDGKVGLLMDDEDGGQRVVGGWVPLQPSKEL